MTQTIEPKKTAFDELTAAIAKIDTMKAGHPQTYRNTCGWVTDRDKLEVAARKFVKEPRFALSSSELATVLAALSYYQEHTPEEERKEISPDLFDDCDPLNDDQIDDLCEWINCEVPIA